MFGESYFEQDIGEGCSAFRKGHLCFGDGDQDAVEDDVSGHGVNETEGVVGYFAYGSLSWCGRGEP